MEPLVSILIPAYNSEQWLAESIESALAQTWQKKEIIVVDDGSKDQTLSIAKQFASRTCPCRYSGKSRGGSRTKHRVFDVSRRLCSVVGR